MARSPLSVTGSATSGYGNDADTTDQGASIGLPVGRRTGPGKRTQVKKEWYVLLEFLRKAIPASIFELPIAIRNGRPLEEEPDFVVTRGGTTDVKALVEITEATDESDQREMTLSERSEKTTLLGEYGGRFSDGACRPDWFGRRTSSTPSSERMESPFSDLHLLFDT